jgi:hypothetical protein
MNQNNDEEKELLKKISDVNNCKIVKEFKKAKIIVKSHNK